jgi:general secretion pathway protein K
VTVHSHRAGLNPEAAPSALFAALAGFPLDEVQTLAGHPFPNRLDRRDPRFPAAFKQVTGGGGLLVHSEVLLPSGQAGLREVIVEKALNAPGQFSIKELRRGRPRYLNDLRSLQQSGAVATLPSC